jgi:hypothetical protein
MVNLLVMKSVVTTLVRLACADEVLSLNVGDVMLKGGRGGLRVRAAKNGVTRTDNQKEYRPVTMQVKARRCDSTRSSLFLEMLLQVSKIVLGLTGT